MDNSANQVSTRFLRETDDRPANFQEADWGPSRHTSAHLSLGAELFEERGEVFHLFWPVGIQVVLLREVVAEVVEFTRLRVFGVAVGLVEPIGNLADGSGLGGDQYPVAMAECVAVGVGVVDQRVASAVCFALDERELVVAVFRGAGGDVGTDELCDGGIDTGVSTAQKVDENRCFRGFARFWRCHSGRLKSANRGHPAGTKSPDHFAFLVPIVVSLLCSGRRGSTGAPGLRTSLW